MAQVVEHLQGPEKEKKKKKTQDLKDHMTGILALALHPYNQVCTLRGKTKATLHPETLQKSEIPCLLCDPQVNKAWSPFLKATNSLIPDFYNGGVRVTL
jgi:hypothetical protein